MNWVERLHRWLMEAIGTLFIYLAAPIIGFSPSLLLSFLAAHTLSAVLNGHMFAMLTHDLFWLSLYDTPEKFLEYVRRMQQRLEQKRPAFISEVVFFGSLTRGVFRKTSDLDIRFVATRGWRNAFRTANLVFIERSLAFIHGFPIDIYMMRTKEEVERKMDMVNEHPVYLFRAGAKSSDVLSKGESFEQFVGWFNPEVNKAR